MVKQVEILSKETKKIQYQVGHNVYINPTNGK